MAGTGAPARDLPAEIADFYDAILEKVAALRVDAHQSMSRIKNEREEMASQLQSDLAQGESLRKADFQKLMGEVIEMRQAREKEVLDMLAEFHREEQAVAQGLRRLFSAGKQARLRDFQKFIAATRSATKKRQAEIEDIREASQDIRKSAEETIAQFREERLEMAKSWQALAETMQAKRPPKTPAKSKNSTSLPRSRAALPRVSAHTTHPQKSTKAKKRGEE